MDREAKKELLRRKQLARFRFKSLCRKVIVNAYWLSAIEDTTMGSNPRRNINIIIRRSGRKGIITLKEKSIFNSPHEERSTEDIERLKIIIESFKCFEMIPPKFRENLVEICHFQYCCPDRVILREGHHASALYFILDGEVNVSKRAYSIDVGKVIDDVQYALIPGDFFGVDGLILGSKRAMTCTAAVHTELLYIRKEDLSEDLHKTIIILWEQTRTALKRFDYYFGHFTEQQIIECCTFSKIRQYKLDDVIYDEDEGKMNTVFFVLSGKCSILQYLHMKYKIINKEKHFTLLDANQCDTVAETEQNPASLPKTINQEIASIPNHVEKNIKNTEIAFVDVATVSAGSIFGLGEKIVQRSIVAKNVVQCLEIPRFWLLQRSQNVGNIWQRTKIFYNTTIPSRELLFDDFVRSTRWNDYREKTVTEIFKSKL